MEDGDGVDAMVTVDERFSKLNGDKKMTRAGLDMEQKRSLASSSF